MNYPECCYQLRGNKFYSDEHGNVYSGSGSCEYGMVNGISNAIHKTIVGKKHAIILITAETLAELARENMAEDYSIIFSIGGIGQDWVTTKAFGGVDINTVYRNLHESLGEFFLRVAKELNYIK